MQGEVQMQSQPVVMPPAPVMPPAGPAQVQVQIPPGLAPGQVFQVNANGQLISVTVPAGCPPGTVLAVAVPPPPSVSLQPQPAPVMPPAAVSLQPQPVMPPAAPQSIVEVPVPAGLTMGSVFHVQVNGMTIPVTVPAPGLPPGTRLNVAGLPSAEAIRAKDERAPGDMTVARRDQNLTKGGCTIPANRNAYKDAQRQNIPPPGAAVGGEWIETPACCCGTYTVYAANGVEYWCPDRNEGDAFTYACENSGDY